MSIHNLKIHRQPFDDLVSGRKTCEVRNCSDRDFKVGDIVELFMTETESGLATESITRTITHIQRGYGLPDDICVLSYGAVLAQEAGHVETEPVAVVRRVKTDISESYEGVILASAILSGSVEDGTKLYTSPPAPVAVMLNEVRALLATTNYSASRDCHNAQVVGAACDLLDKVKELNQ